MPIASVIADANMLLSAAVGKAALRVFTKFTVMVHVAQFNADEVAEYLPHMASKYELPLELVEMQWKLLPLQIHSTDEYRGRLPQAMADLKDRDPIDLRRYEGICCCLPHDDSPFLVPFYLPAEAFLYS